MSDKNMHYANFNITYGEHDDPMLCHFEDMIFPAFTSGFHRGKEGEYPLFYFDEIQIKEINGEYVLCGNYIKDMQYKINTTIQDGKLVSTPANVPSAPYSRFIIFLKNHRMILVRNESQSPDIRSFQTTVKRMLSSFVSKENASRDKNNKLPIPHVNIIDLPMRQNIEKTLQTVHKIKSLKFRFFPLNNDIPSNFMANAVKQEMQKVQSKHAGIHFTSPGSKKAVSDLIEESAGLAEATLEVSDRNGNKTKIKGNSFSASKKISFGRDIYSSDDEYIVDQAKQDDIITHTSDDNKKLYQQFLGVIKKLMQK
ncbi:MAG: hypothetical protein J6K16_04200 [Alphaproteobacteria bacterium]|nr:hypothetical protein [Alphaproteobacteria bacterium]